MKRRSRNEGSIFFRPSKKLWVAKITLPDGKTRLKYAKDQKTVREWLQVQQNQLRQGLLPKDEQVTVAQFLGNYMETVGKHTLRPKTIEAYSYLIRIHILPALGKIKLSQLRPDHIQSLYAQTLEKGLSRRTVYFIHSILHKSLEQALRWGLVVRNVSDLVDPPSPAKRQPTVYTPDQVHQFLASAKGHRFYALFVLAIYGGFREGELLGLQVEDCHLDTGLITVNHAVQYQLGKGVVITEPKTDRSKRSVKLPVTAVKVLKRHIKELNRNQGLLFTTASGKPINPRFLIKSFKEAIRDAGLPEIRFHDLRHTSATLLLLANVNPRVVQERLGHSSVTLTLSTYSHILPAMQDEAAEKMERILGSV
jgi:integrase